MSSEEENKRISLQVTSLSTQLIESIEKQGTLEQKLAHLERENTHIKERTRQLEPIEERYRILQKENRELISRLGGLDDRLQTEIKEKEAAKDNVTKLEREVEDLSASLFEEANKMVADARRKEHEIQLRNDSLVTQLKEKDTVIDDLQSQLNLLKDVLHARDLEEEEVASKRGSALFNASDVNLHQKLIIYSPTIDAVRYDLKMFSEFKKFVKTIKDYDSIKDTDTKFIKKLLSDDVEPALRLDLSPGIAWLNKRSTVSAIIDGRVSISPVSGINETYRLNFQNDKASDTDVKSNLYTYPPHSPPVAMQEPCALCGEARDDILEHSRLYIMKVYSKQDSTSAVNNVTPAVSHTYPLCSYCLFRLRSVCELFAFLRSLKTDAWKLTNENMVKKAWIELARLRAKLFWAKVGIWDIDSNIVTTKVSTSTEDAVYKSIIGTADPSRMSIYSSTDSLVDPRTVDTNGYKSSPLINQIEESPQAVVVSSPPATPAKVVMAPVDGDDDEEDAASLASHTSISQEAIATEALKAPATIEKNGTLEEDGDDVDDIIGNYSHDEAEDEDEAGDAETAVPSKVGGLHIHTSVDEERPQDFLLDSSENTPIVSKIKSEVATPVLETGFDFEKQSTPTKDVEKEKVESKESEEPEQPEQPEDSEPLEQPEEPEAEATTKKDSNPTTDDESEFVDA
ncbi:Rab guanine nucleotide exchange factor SEC2 [Cyberlindnera fabianii]|uniref:Rab guanine nucleotide exchange factor SEC2 n=1 Tax=Cyberlindnera fabianii TaxID=36022 RepID=A0A1V2LBM0_CYBFA|nr:Rab guanine nucleotide exchange factor SEC2 [Cyberlindnera fabianii]